MSSEKICHLKDRLVELERFYHGACVQLSVLNVAMDELSHKYERADRGGDRTFRYILRMRMAMTEGVRNMFYEYATQKAFQISKVRQNILVEHAFSEESGDELDDNFLGYGVTRYVDDDEDEEDSELDETTEGQITM
ncbi:hypothetical protein KP79_PYT17249 [Mizuhopecten yessoensis]|uniref:Uncharacterized protein n=1 Tax=Mizuhopecten yessoensis TaxID=6573 RepID=A0A210PPE3_MIZYE|nr:hypothetical protein KP79_PYT17249 [Mizuhopecten yessoensis]